MKALGVLILITLTVVLSAVVSVYITLYVSEKKSDIQNSGRYQLIFGTIRHTSSEPSLDEPGIVTQRSSDQSVCFKFDTSTGRTWRYVSDFYTDPNEVATTRGFERILADDGFPYRIRNVSKRGPEEIRFTPSPLKQKPKLVLDEPNKP